MVKQDVLHSAASCLGIQRLRAHAVVRVERSHDRVKQLALEVGRIGELLLGVRGAEPDG